MVVGLEMMAPLLRQSEALVGYIFDYLQFNFNISAVLSSMELEVAPPSLALPPSVAPPSLCTQ